MLTGRSLLPCSFSSSSSYLRSMFCQRIAHCIVLLLQLIRALIVRLLETHTLCHAAFHHRAGHLAFHSVKDLGEVYLVKDPPSVFPPVLPDQLIAISVHCGQILDLIPSRLLQLMHYLARDLVQ